MALCGNITACPGVALPEEEASFFFILDSSHPSHGNPLTIYVFNYLSIHTSRYCLLNVPLRMELPALRLFAFN